MAFDLRKLPLEKQIGPLPLGAWIVVVVAGLGFALWTRAHSDPTPLPNGNGSKDGGKESGKGGSWTYVNPPKGPVAPNIRTNKQWGTYARNYLIAERYPPAEVKQAVTKYLKGEKLTVVEAAMIHLAIAKYGEPPEPIPVRDDYDKETIATLVVPGSVPNHVHNSYGGGASLADLAQQYYGNPTRWVDIFNANKFGMKRPDGLPGTLETPNDIPSDDLYIP